VTDQKQEEHVRFSSQNVGQSALAVLTGLAAPLHRRVLLTDPLAGHAGERPPRRPDAGLGRGKQSSPRTASRRSQRTTSGRARRHFGFATKPAVCRDSLEAPLAVELDEKRK
jgi:hypothetical protein